MNPLIEAGLTVLGGIISALGGIAVAIYQLKSQNRGTRQDWYARTVVLADQVVATVDRHGDDGSKYSTARMMLTLSSQLREHASSVPNGVETDVIESLDETAYYCEAAVSATPDGSLQQEYKLSTNRIQEAETKADQLSSKANAHLN